MNLKSKIFGFAAASVFALSLTTGAMAYTPNPNASVGASVELKPTYCSVFLNNGNSVDFGDWNWDPTTGANGGWTVDAANKTQNLTGTVLAGQLDGTCNVTLKFEGLKDGSGSIKIPHNNFSGTVVGIGSQSPLGQSTFTGNVGQMKNQSGSLTLNTVPEDVAPGTYNGTIELKVNATN